MRLVHLHTVSSPSPFLIQINKTTNKKSTKKERTVVQGLKVVGEGEDIGMPDRYLTQDRNLVPDHVLFALHQLLANHFHRISLS